MNEKIKMLVGAALDRAYESEPQWGQSVVDMFLDNLVGYGLTIVSIADTQKE